MDIREFEQLSLKEKEQIVLNQGQFIEAQDEYSYKLVHYTFEDKRIELMYDNETDNIVSVTIVEEDDVRNIDLDIDTLEDL